ncbi:MAG TPA: LuxR C-terminal-related transcriptional regulator [Armatimonadota bacterium]|nr:LuxR C-terminal-related transcriptional regulator [Armatimonadota bacterium]
MSGYLPRSTTQPALGMSREEAVETGRPERSESASPLENQADRLLIASAREQGRGEYPFYTQRWIEIVGEHEHPAGDRAEGWPDEVRTACASGGDDPESRATLARLVVDAQLTRKQRTVIRWLQLGLSQTQIAEMLGLSEASVTRLKQAALEQMRRVAEQQE